MTTQWTAGAARGPCETDNRTWEASSLTYTSEPLEADTKFTGPLVANVWAELTSKDATLVSVLSDVAPSGESNQVTAGFLLASQRAVDPARSTRRGRHHDQAVPPVHAREPAAGHARTTRALPDRDLPDLAIFRKGDRIRLDDRLGRHAGHLATGSGVVDSLAERSESCTADVTNRTFYCRLRPVSCPGARVTPASGSAYPRLTSG